MKQFIREFKVSTATVLDIGGPPFNWTLDSISTSRPAQILTRVRSNGGVRRSPSALRSCSFDIVYSNSVVDHVGRWESQRAFASQRRRGGELYLIRTPDKWFSIGPLDRATHPLAAAARKDISSPRHFTVRGILERPS